MQRRRSNFSKFMQTKAFSLLFSLGVAFTSLMGCLFIFSIIVSKIDVPKGTLAVFSTVSLCVGAYFGGFSCAKKQRKNGLIMGLITGAVMFFVIFISSIIFSKTALSISGFSKLLWAVIFGAIGGIVGVNSKRHNF